MMNPLAESDLLIYGLETPGPNFKLQLACPIELSDTINYELALVKCSHSRYFKNIYKSEIKYFSFADNRILTTSIPNKFYETIEQFTAEFNKSFTQENRSYYQLQYSEDEGFLLSCKTDGVRLPFISLSEDLSSFCGLAKTYAEQGVHTGLKKPDFSGGNNFLYFYCNELEPINMGGARKAPLLCVLPNRSLDANTKSMYIHHEVTRPVYNSLVQHKLDSLKFTVQNEQGFPFPFQDNSEIFILVTLRPNLKSI